MSDGSSKERGGQGRALYAGETKSVKYLEASGSGFCERRGRTAQEAVRVRSRAEGERGAPRMGPVPSAEFIRPLSAPRTLSG